MSGFCTFGTWVQVVALPAVVQVQCSTIERHVWVLGLAAWWPEPGTTFCSAGPVPQLASTSECTLSLCCCCAACVHTVRVVLRAHSGHVGPRACMLIMCLLQVTALCFVSEHHSHFTGLDTGLVSTGLVSKVCIDLLVVVPCLCRLSLQMSSRCSCVCGWSCPSTAQLTYVGLWLLCLLRTQAPASALSKTAAHSEPSCSGSTCRGRSCNTCKEMC